MKKFKNTESAQLWASGRMLKHIYVHMFSIGHCFGLKISMHLLFAPGSLRTARVRWLAASFRRFQFCDRKVTKQEDRDNASKLVLGGGGGTPCDNRWRLYRDTHTQGRREWTCVSTQTVLAAFCIFLYIFQIRDQSKWPTASIWWTRELSVSCIMQLIREIMHHYYIWLDSLKIGRRIFLHLGGNFLLSDAKLKAAQFWISLLLIEFYCNVLGRHLWLLGLTVAKGSFISLYKKSRSVYINLTDFVQC